MTHYPSTSGPQDRIDLLIDQVGRLTEVVTIGFQDMRTEFNAMRQDMRTEFNAMRQDMRDEFKAMREDMRTEFREMRVDLAEIKQITERQAQVAEQQAQSVARLAAIVETLIQRNQADLG